MLGAAAGRARAPTHSPAPFVVPDSGRHPPYLYPGIGAPSWSYLRFFNQHTAAATQGIPVPCMASALAYYDGYRCGRLPANLLQAQRDFFGAHTYERTDKPRGEFFHTNWTGRGGTTASTTYNA